jgi:MinD superfamily P-loop ATPase
MAEKQKAIGDWLVVWNNKKDGDPEYHIFHAHETEKQKNLYKYCVPVGEDEETWICRICNEKCPVGVVYFGKTRRLSEDDA